MSDQGGGRRPPKQARIEPGQISEEVARALRNAQPPRPVDRRARFARAMPIIAGPEEAKPLQKDEPAVIVDASLPSTSGPSRGRPTIVPDGSQEVLLPVPRPHPDPRARSGRTSPGFAVAKDQLLGKDQPKSGKK